MPELKCPDCGGIIEQGWKLCPYCGSELHKMGHDEQKTQIYSDSSIEIKEEINKLNENEKKELEKKIKEKIDEHKSTKNNIDTKDVSSSSSRKKSIFVIIGVVVISLVLLNVIKVPYYVEEAYTEMEPYTDTEAYTVQEPYQVTETYYEKESYVANECRYVYPNYAVNKIGWTEILYWGYKLEFVNNEKEYISIKVNAYFFDGSKYPYSNAN